MSIYDAALLIYPSSEDTSAKEKTGSTRAIIVSHNVRHAFSGTPGFKAFTLWNGLVLLTQKNPRGFHEIRHANASLEKGSRSAQPSEDVTKMS